MTKAVVIAALAVLAFGAGSQAGVRHATCTAGITKFNGVTARVFCGPAKATVHYGTKVLKFSGGSCEKGTGYISVNIGEVVLGQQSKPKPDYFGLNVGKVPFFGGSPAPRDGTYTGDGPALVFKGKGYLTKGQSFKVTLAGNRSRGTFTGDSLFASPDVKVTGTFSC